jgi:hypothetical protein
LFIKTVKNPQHLIIHSEIGPLVVRVCDMRRKERLSQCRVSTSIPALASWPHNDPCCSVLQFLYLTTKRFTKAIPRPSATIIKMGLDQSLVNLNSCICRYMLYVNNEFECFIRGSKHEKTVWNTSAKRECFIVFECLVPW